MTQHNVLFELGCEELPPKNLKILRDALQQEVAQRLDEAGFQYQQIQAYAAPRRLALHITQLDAQQPDRTEERRGPAVAAAFKPDGSPTPAASGFAKGAGVDVAELERVMTDKGEWLVHRKQIKGQTLEQLLPAILQDSLNALPIAKRMRSAASRTEFVRPVQWVVLMKDDQVIPATIQDFTSGNQSWGHRFHAPEAITLIHADTYLPQLEQAFVMASFEQRQTLIQQQVKRLADEVSGIALTPDSLMDEVTALVEWPVALRAQFEERFLQVPQEALISTMQDNQKYFCLVDNAGKLLPYFITVSNINSRDPAQIIAGNEKVVRPRLTDAEFFYKQDQKLPLEARREKLENMIFQQQLGTLWDKTERIAALASHIASQTGGNPNHAKRAAVLAKMDLASEMVGEFPELQGIAGSYYAVLENEPADVSQAIREQYLPKFAGDELPQSSTGLALALADRLDTLAGIFGINQPPTGNKDPFSLRRAAIGVLRLLTEKQLELSLTALLQQAVAGLDGKIKDPAKTLAAVSEFIQGRYRAMYEDQGIAVDTIQAVQALNPDSPLDFDRRLRAVQTFRALPDAAALAAANKRVANILAKDSFEQGDINASLLQDEAEKSLHTALEELRPQLDQLYATRQYDAMLALLATLRAPVDQFFEKVMVNTDDPAIKLNRLRLLNELRQQFIRIADISLLQN